MKRLQIYSTALSVGCAVGVLMAVIVTKNENSLPRTAVVVPTKKPNFQQKHFQAKLQAELSKAQSRFQPDGIDRVTTSAIPRRVGQNSRQNTRRNISDIISSDKNAINPFPGAKNTIIVQSGDTLFGIARRVGINAHKLARINSIEPPFVIRPGQILHFEANR